MKSRSIVLSVGILSFATSVSSASFVAIGNPSQTGGFAYALNNLGEVATTSLVRSFTFADASYASSTEIAIPNVATTTPGIVAQGMNDAGDVVGRFRVAGNPANQTSGFLRRPSGLIETYNYPGLASTSISAINDLGEMVGETRSELNAFGVIRGFLYSGSTFSEVHVPGAVLTRAYGINDSGLIVGQFQNSDGLNRAFVRNGGVYSELTPVGAPGGVRSAFATGISDDGVVVGSYRNSADTASATWLRLADGSYLYPSLPGIGWSVNNSLQISGSFLDAQNANVRTAFISSVPEPSSLIAVGSAIGWLVVFSRSRRRDRQAQLPQEASGLLSAAVAVVAVTVSASPANAQHAGDVQIGRNGAMQLVATNLPPETVRLPFISSTLLNVTGWASTDLGFDRVRTADPTADLFTMNVGGDVYLELVGVDPGLSFRSFFSFGVFADDPGDTLTLGTTASLHYHPVVFIDAGVVGLGFRNELTASFRLVDQSGAHSASPVYSLTFSPEPSPIPEPASLSLLAGAVVVALSRRRANSH